MRIAVAALAAAVLGFSSWPSLAQSVEDFYKGKQVSLLIGFGPGGANDAWARALARHMTKHLPGRPTVVPQNMPGAGTLKLANHLYNVAPKDGSVFGLINRGIPLEPLLGGDAAQFDPLKMNWLGSPDKDTTVCAARKDAQVQTMHDLFAKELVVGATGSGADTAIYPEFLAEFSSPTNPWRASASPPKAGSISCSRRPWRRTLAFRATSRWPWNSPRARMSVKPSSSSWRGSRSAGLSLRRLASRRSGPRRCGPPSWPP